MPDADLVMTCGTCGHRFADNTPAGRCPREAEHAEIDSALEKHRGGRGWICIERQYAGMLMVGPYRDLQAATKALVSPLLDELTSKDCLDAYAIEGDPPLPDLETVTPDDDSTCPACWGILPPEGVQMVPDDGALCTCPEGRIEAAVKVYLIWDGAARTWVVDQINLDGHPLPFEPEPYLYDDEAEVDSEVHKRILAIQLKEAQEANAPTGSELLYLMNEALA